MQGLEEMSMGQKREWTLHGPHSKQLSHWLLAALRAAAQAASTQERMQVSKAVNVGKAKQNSVHENRKRT